MVEAKSRLRPQLINAHLSAVLLCTVSSFVKRPYSQDTEKVHHCSKSWMHVESENISTVPVAKAK